VFCVEAGTYFFVVQHVSGGMGRVDFVEFIPTTPVEQSSWGSIKSLFR
jgi:hypothetical protein